MATSMLHIRMEDDLKAAATAALSAIGLSTAEAVRLFFHRIVAEQGFPLELKVPNEETRRAMEESRRMMKEGRARFTSAEDMIASLERGE